MINFNILYNKALETGLRIDIIPICSEKFEYEYKEYLCLSEAAFGFIEKCISCNSIKYTNFSHWGLTIIDKNEWKNIIKCLYALVAKWENAREIDDIIMNINIYDDIKEFNKLNFKKLKNSFIDMCTKVITWVEEKIIKYPFVAISGV